MGIERKLLRAAVQVLVLLIGFACSRLMLWALNTGNFEKMHTTEMLRILCYGIRFDLSAICAVNSLYWLLFLLPVKGWPSVLQDKVLQTWFIASNSMAFLFEIADWAYFPYNHKRSTADVLNMLNRKSDFLNLLPTFVRDYWYLFLIAAVGVILFTLLNRKICRWLPLGDTPARNRFLPVIIYLAALGSCFIGIRGGLQLIPIGLRNAAGITQSSNIPLILNTPFSIMTTLGARNLEAATYMSEAEAEKMLHTRKHFTDKPFRAKNVVVIVLESFSKEFTGIGGMTSYTPFLDSLMQQGLICTQGFANGYHSAEGIPAIFAGVPSLMDEPFTTSLYGTNEVTSLPGTLKQKGYSSAFYHGGSNGTMSFDIFCRNAQFDRYMGRTEYNNEDDFDNDWGIWDEPFLQFAAKDISDNLPEPFCAGIFTLTSHHPYRIPDKYKGQFPGGKLQIYETIGYTDFSLRKFFRTASTKSWFNNTLFVLVADHCSALSANEYYNMHQGRFAIPILFFAPGDPQLKGQIARITQQLDILPTVLDYLGYDKPFFAFGNSILRHEGPSYSVQYIDGHLGWMMDRFFLQMNGNQVSGIYDRLNDSLDKKDLAHTIQQDTFQPLRYERAFWQLYTDKLIRNRLFIRK